MTLDEVRAMLRHEIAYEGGFNGWCAANNVARSHAHEFLAGKRNPQTDLLEALGLEWSVTRKLTEGSSPGVTPAKGE